MKKLALVVEDEPELVELIKEPLEELGFEVVSANDGEIGLELALKGGYSIILLDLKLPKVEGTDICRKVRERDSSTPIIILTAITDEVSTALLLELGADDYVNKPFRKIELKARIKALIRRATTFEKLGSDIIKIKDLEIDASKRRAVRGGEAIDFTAKEFDILLALALAPGCPFTRDELNERLYGHSVLGYDHSISSHINRMRSKLEADPAEPQYILTVRGVGYCMAEDECS